MTTSYLSLRSNAIKLGNAHSNGNAYGTAASFGVFLVPLMFIRLFAPQQYLQGIILMEVCHCLSFVKYLNLQPPFQATIVLIVGYSWIDGHLPLISNVGIGWPVAWKRWTLVMIGVSSSTFFCIIATNTKPGAAASFILMLLPPKSARKAVRLGCAKTLNSMSHMYALLMSAWITNTPTFKELQSGQSPRASSFRNNLAAVALQLRNLKDLAGLARWEGNVRGHWPYAEYDRLVDAQLEMTSVIAQVSRVSVCELRTLADFRKSSQVRSWSSTTNGEQDSCITPKSSTRTSFVSL